MTQWKSLTFQWALRTKSVYYLYARLWTSNLIYPPVIIDTIHAYISGPNISVFRVLYRYPQRACFIILQLICADLLSDLFPSGRQTENELFQHPLSIFLPAVLIKTGEVLGRGRRSARTQDTVYVAPVKKGEKSDPRLCIAREVLNRVIDLWNRFF